MRRLDGIFGGFLVGALLVPLGVFLTYLAEDAGLLPMALASAGTAVLAVLALWMAFVEAFLPGLDRLRVTRGLFTVGVALPILSIAAAPLESPLGLAIRAAIGLAAVWGVSEVWLSTIGPPRPPSFPLAVFREVSRGLRKAPVLEGSAEGLPLSIEYSRNWQGVASERRSLTCESSRELELGPLTLLGSFTARQRTGDAAFDDAVHAKGPRAIVLALLRAPARSAILEVVKAGGTLFQGALRGDERLSPALLARAGHALAVESVNAGLRSGIENDPVPDVRLACLEQLVISDLGGADSLAGCRAAIRDADPRVRVLAASHLLLQGDAAAEEVLAASTIGLGAVIAGLLQHAEGTTAEALLRVLGARGGPDAKPAVEAFVARSSGPLRELAEATLASVVERAAAGRGRVSLQEASDAGAVSIADGAGAVSLPPKKAPAG